MNKKPGSFVSVWSADKVLAILFLIVNLFAGSNAVAQNTWNGSTSTDWNTATNWSLNHVPLAAEAVVIPNSVASVNDNPVISGNAVCSTLTITGGAAAVSLSINSGISLAVSTTVSIGAGTGPGDNIILNVGAGSLSATSISMATTGNDNRATSLTISTGTVTIAGTITMNDADIDRNIVSISGIGTLNVTGGITGGNLTTVVGSTVNYNGAAQTVRAVTYSGNLTLSGTGSKTITSATVNGTLSIEGTATASAPITFGAAATLQYNTATARSTTVNEWPTPFNGTGGVIIQSTGIITLDAARVLGTGAPLSISSGATLATGNFALTFGGNFTNSGTFTAGSSPITITGNAVQSIAGFTTTGLVSATKNGGIATLTGNVNGAGLTNTTGGTLNLGVGRTHTFTGDWTRTNGTLDGGSSTLRIGGNVSGAGGTFTASTSTVEWFAAGAQTVAGVTYNNLILSGSGAKTTASVTVNGILSMEGTATASAAIVYGAAATLQYNTATSRTVSSNEWLATFNGTGGVLIQNTGVITLNAAKVLGNGAQVNISSGATLSTNNLALTFGGDFINAGTFTAGSSAITIAGTATQNIAGFTTTGLVSMTKTGGTATLAGNANGAGLTINGAGGTLNLGAGLTHTFTGTWTRTAGTLNGGSSNLRIGGSVSGTGGTFTASSGTVEWNALGAQTLADVIYNNLTLSGSGIKTLQGGTTIIGGNLQLSGSASTTAVVGLSIGGSVTLESGTTFAAGAFTHNVAGDWINNGGTFTNTGSTINLNGTAQNIGGSSSTTFNNLILAGSGTKTFSIATVTGGKMIVITGVVANLSTLNHFANSLRIGGVGQPIGTSGSTSSPAVNTNNTFFAATSGFVTVLSTVPSETYYSIATGNWNSNATWSTVSFVSAVNLGGFPAAGDIVNIGGGSYTVTVNVNSACASMSYQGNTGNSPTVSLSNGIALNVSGAIYLPSTSGIGNINTLAVGAGTLTAASIDFDMVSTFGRNAFTISTGTATISGDVTGGTIILTAIQFSGSGLLRLGGSFLGPLNCSFTASTGTVEYNGTVAQTVQNLTYNNLTFSGAGLKSGIGDTDVNGVITLGSGTSFTPGPNTYTVAGNWVNNGTTFDYTGSTITLDGAAQSIGGSNATTFNNLTLAGSNTKTFGFLTTMDGILSINSGVVANLGTITTHQARALSLNGSGQVSGTWGSNASAATNKTDTYFTLGTTGEVIITNRVYYTHQSGPWTTNATWSTVTYANATNLGAFPVAGDIVNIGGGAFAVTVDANAACASLNFLGGASDSHSVSINAGITLNVSGVIDIPNAANFSGDLNTFAVGSGILNTGGIAFSTALFATSPLFTIGTGTVTVNGDVTQSGFGNVDLTFSGAGLLQLRGAFLNSGNCDFTASTGTVQYISTTEAQSIGNFTYYNLTLNNTFSSTGQLSLVGNTTATNVLTMTSGRVNLNGSTMTLSSSAVGALVHNFSSTAGWMYGGSISRAFPVGSISMGVNPSVDGMLPIGTSTNFRPFYFAKTNLAGSSGTITMTHSDPGTTTSGLNIVDPSGGSNVILRNNASWSSTLTGGGAAVFRIRYGGTGLGTVTNLGHLRAMLLNSIIQTHVGATGSLTDPAVERNNLTAAQMSNSFYVGSTDAASPLPIELLYFNAKLSNDAVVLSWATASELDNDFFTIERATNIEEFETIGDPIDGRGTTNEKNSYFAKDENPIYGRSYYRLKQTDFDGKFTYSALQVINYEGPRFSSLQVYPNPSHGNSLTVLITGLKEQATVPVQIYNVQGQKVYDQVLDVNTPGTLRYDVEFNSPLKQGLYIIKAGQTLQLTQKIIVD